MKKTLFWLTAFSIAMGYLETSVVVYLRVILYPEGFEFPLKPINQDLVVTELWREAATILMLVGAGIMAGKNAIQRFAYFIYCFAIWDIFYYVFLKLLIDWPASLLTWDVLFLLPVTWTGPVLTPVIISCLMIIMTAELLFLSDSNKEFRVSGREWAIMISGSIVVIVAFCWDYGTYIVKNHSLSKLWSLTDEELFDVSINYIPQSFNWPLFFFGIALILTSMALIWRKHSPSLK